MSEGWTRAQAQKHQYAYAPPIGKRDLQLLYRARQERDEWLQELQDYFEEWKDTDPFYAQDLLKEMKKLQRGYYAACEFLETLERDVAKEQLCLMSA